MSDIKTKTISQSVATLKQLYTAKKFPAFIDFVRLHSFKNIADLTNIKLEFPVTALIGANGCGKSSVLQALYGCPEGYSLGRYWFSTKLDPISEDNGSRPYLVYGYRSETGEEREVVKTRIKWDKKAGSSQNLDYWEPSRPIKKLGMKLIPGGGRHPAAVKDVMVIDFRYQLSAFDRYFHLEEVEPYHAKKRRSQQDVIRLRSEAILQALNTKESRPNKAEPVYNLTEAQCSTISTILGKRYRSGKVLHHRLHGFWANTVVFESESLANPLRYTEANAGSGEVAVALMVYKLSKANQGSLVLLDEPEYSLHPGAQREVLKYLLQQCVEKKLQIVFTTHAPSMVEGLPTSAIKVFEQDPLTDKFVVHQDRSVEEAFLSIGQRSPVHATIRVEDALAKELVEEVLNRMVKKGDIPQSFTKLVDVKFLPGGVGSMKQDIALYSRDANLNVFTVFDGTECTDAKIDLQKLTVGERTPDKLKATLKTITNEDIRFAVDGGTEGGRPDQLVGAIELYVNYWNRRVRFLPFDVPEAEIWNQELGRKELEAVLENHVEIEAELAKLTSLNAKDRFSHLALTISNRNQREHIIALQTKFLKHWLKSNSESLKAIESMLSEIRTEFGNDKPSQD